MSEKNEQSDANEKPVQMVTVSLDLSTSFEYPVSDFGDGPMTAEQVLDHLKGYYKSFEDLVKDMDLNEMDDLMTASISVETAVYDENMQPGYSTATWKHERES